MRKFFAPISILILRLGLALTFLYSGWSLLWSPVDWVGFAPLWFRELLPISLELYLRIQGGVELLWALSLVSGIAIRYAALLASAELAGILIFYGVDLISFRDLGILGSALALTFYYWYEQEERHPK